MKRLLPVTPILLLLALLLSPGAALAGAKQGLSLWWGSVFPSLLPSFICLKLAQKLGLLRLAGHQPRGRLAAVMGFSLLSGAPNGARLLNALVEDGSLSCRNGSRLLPLVNSVSPAFLLSIIASELLKNKALFLPMAVSFYGCAILLSFPIFLQCAGSDHAHDPMPLPSVPFADALAAAMEESMLDMLRIGGCILFSCTLLFVIRQAVPGPSASAALAISMEISTGASAIATLDLPLRLRVSLLVGAAAFGGLSLGLQTLCCFPKLKLVPYLVKKLLYGALVGLVCYLIFPLFPSVAAAFASRQEILFRSLSLSALLLSSVLSTAFIGVLSLMIGPKNRNSQKYSCN